MPSQGRSRRAVDDLRELAADVVQVAASRAGPRARAGAAGARMPSYLSSTQTGRAEPADDLRGVLGRRREHELERVEQRQLGVVEPVRRGPGPPSGRRRRSACRPTSPRRAAGRTPWRCAASSSPSRSPMRSSPRQHLDDVAWPSAGSDRARSARRIAALRGGPGRRLDRRERVGAPRGASGSTRRVGGSWPAPRRGRRSTARPRSD